MNPPSAAARAPGLDRLGLLVTGLAEVRVQVHEAGRDDAAGRVEHAVAVEPRADGRDDAVLDEDVGGPFAGRVDDATAAEHEPSQATGAPEPSSW